MSKMDNVVTTKLTEKSKFRFRCHKGIACFTRCCRNIDIMITPYDIIRLKNKLGISSEEFLDKYTIVKIDEKSSHPHLFLMMNDDEERTCPFVTSEGCTVYADRPANCRYYPIGQGTLKKEGKDGPEEEEFYFIIKEPHCYGFEEKKGWTVASWKEDQGVDRYDEINREWKALQLRRNLYGQDELDEKKKMQFFMASYNIDKFRDFVFKSNFLNVFDVDEETVDKIRDDEIELLRFGFKYIKYIMMLEETFKLKKGASAFRKRREK